MAKTTKPAPKVTTNRQAVEELLESLRRAGPIDSHDEALGLLALTLADALDEGVGQSTAAVARELRIALAILTAKEVVPDEQASSIFGSDL